MKRMSEELAVDTKTQKLEHIFIRIGGDAKLMQFFAEIVDLQLFSVLCRLNKSWNTALLSTIQIQAIRWFEKRKRMDDEEDIAITAKMIINTDLRAWLSPQCWQWSALNWHEFVIPVHGQRYASYWRMYYSDDDVLDDLPDQMTGMFNLKEGNCVVELALQGRSMTLLRELRMRGGDIIMMSIRHCWRRLDEMNFVRVEELATEFGKCAYEKLVSNDNIMSMVYAEPGLVHLQRHPWLMHHEWFLNRYDYVTRVVAEGEGEKLIPFLMQKKLIDAFCDRFQEGYLEKSIVMAFMENIRQFLKR